MQYRDGFNFTWANGRQLSTVTNGTNTYSYTYNADGLRTSKTVNGTTTEYYWMGSVLQGQKTGSEYILYLYDENGTAYGFLLKNGTTQEYYYYIFNAQGDVIGILNSAGTKVVEYTYSAWGEVLSVTGTKAGTIGQTNPIRYRGYYHDTETGFYYLRSRYYDPTTQRFINCDKYASTGQGILGDNMFAYCGNDPVNCCDCSGECKHRFWLWDCEDCKEKGTGYSLVGVLTEIGNAISNKAYAFFGVGSVAIVDGPAPVGDAVAALSALTLLAVCVVEGVYNYAQSSSKAESKPKDTYYYPPSSTSKYWEAELIGSQVVVKDPLNAQQAALRVSQGGNIMCRDRAAAKHIIFINGYVNYVGPEKGCGNGYFWHYHPTRNHTGSKSVHIWYYGE